MKKIFVFAVLSMSIFGCTKEMTYSRKIEHKWQYVSDELKFTDGKEKDTSYVKTELEYWSFDNGELEQTRSSGKANFSYTVNGDLLQLKGKNNLNGFDVGYPIKSLDDENMILLFELTDELGQKEGELNMRFKKVD